MASSIWKCSNFGGCEKADKHDEIPIPPNEHEPKCPECGKALMQIGGTKPPPWKVIGVVIVVVVAMVTVVLIFNKSRPALEITPPAETELTNLPVTNPPPVGGAGPEITMPPPHPAVLPDKDIVIAIDGGIFLNALMVHTPAWFIESCGNSPGPAACSFGLWGFRPLEYNGLQENLLQNYTPVLGTSELYSGLSIIGAPDPSQITNKVSISYDLFGDLKSVIEETKWNSSTNRNLIIITATSGFLKTDPENSLQLDESAVKQIADSNNVTLFCIYINIPVDAIAQDREVARRQLTVLSGQADHFYTVSTENPGSWREVTGYGTSIKDVFKKIFQQISPPDTVSTNSGQTP